MMNKKFKKIYENCIRHAEDTESFWTRVCNFLSPMYTQEPEQVLLCYNTLEVYMYGEK